MTENGIVTPIKDKDGTIDVPQEELTPTGKFISDEEKEMLTDIKSQASEYRAALNATQSLLGRSLERISKKYKLGEKQVIGDDGQIMTVSDELFMKLKMQNARS